MLFIVRCVTFSSRVITSIWGNLGTCVGNLGRFVGNIGAVWGKKEKKFRWIFKQFVPEPNCELLRLLVMFSSLFRSLQPSIETTPTSFHGKSQRFSEVSHLWPPSRSCTVHPPPHLKCQYSGTSLIQTPLDQEKVSWLRVVWHHEY